MENMKLVKIYNDGNHFVCHEVRQGIKGNKAKRDKTDLDNLFDLIFNELGKVSRTLQHSSKS